MTLVTSWPQFVPRAQPLIKSLAERALGNKSSQEGEWSWFRNVLLHGFVLPPSDFSLLLLLLQVPATCYVWPQRKIATLLSLSGSAPALQACAYLWHTRARKNKPSLQRTRLEPEFTSKSTHSSGIGNRKEEPGCFCGVFARCVAASSLCIWSARLGSARADLKKMAAPQTKKMVLETAHPYSHNADRKETVRIEGAKKLIISFDDRTRCAKGTNRLPLLSVQACYTCCAR